MELSFRKPSYYVIEIDNVFNPTIIHRDIIDLTEAIKLTAELKNIFPSYTYHVCEVNTIFVL